MIPVFGNQWMMNITSIELMTIKKTKYLIMNGLLSWKKLRNAKGCKKSLICLIVSVLKIEEYTESWISEQNGNLIYGNWSVKRNEKYIILHY